MFWEKSDIEWSSRWDAYLLANAPNDKVKHRIVIVAITITDITLIVVVIANVIIANVIIDIPSDIDVIVTRILYKTLVHRHITPLSILHLSHI